MIAAVTSRAAVRIATRRATVSHSRSLATYFTADHEYVKVEGDEATIGVTDFAQEKLGDVVYVGLPTVGDEFDCEDPVASVESVKAASDVYAPYAGTITAVNEELDSDPSLVNSAAEGDGWFFRMTAPTEGDIATLLDADAYKALCEEEG